MKHFATCRVLGLLAMALLAGSLSLYAGNKDKENNGKGNNQRQQGRQGTPNRNDRRGLQPQQPGQGPAGNDASRRDRNTGQNDQASGGRTKDNDRPDDSTATVEQGGRGRQDVDRNKGSERRDGNAEVAATKPKLETRQTSNGYEKTAPSGRVRERMEDKPDGKHLTQFSPGGAKQKETLEGKDGSRRDTDYDLRGRARREEIAKPDGSREVSSHQYARDGNVRAKEMVKYDVHEKTKIVSKTVVKTVNKTTYVTHYNRGRFGFVYAPAVVVVDPFWYDPFWYSPAGVVIVHPFRYSWGWHGGWYAYYGPYWAAYPVYPAPSYWVTDWMVADYLRDRYETSVSVEQARADARAAREEAEKARQAAEAAKDAAEIAEAKADAARAELRAKNAEERAERAAHLEAQAGKTNPNATPIDQETKESLRGQIEQTISERKELAEAAKNGGTPTIPDVSKALADPKHIYPVSKVLSVTTPDSNPAGYLSEGDLLKVEPGQDDILKNPTEDTLVKMRVITSKGEDDEVKAGTVVNVSVRDLQDFDSDFRAKLDTGLAEAAKNQDAFKKGAANSNDSAKR